MGSVTESKVLEHIFGFLFIASGIAFIVWFFMTISSCAGKDEHGAYFTTMNNDVYLTAVMKCRHGSYVFEPVFPVKLETIAQLSALVFGDKAT